MRSSEESTVDQADSTVQELKALLQDAQKALGEKDPDAAAHLAERTQTVIEKGREAGRRAMRAARERAADADEAMHEHPYAAIGVAAAMGLLLGALLSRGHNR